MSEEQKSRTQLSNEADEKFQEMRQAVFEQDRAEADERAAQKDLQEAQTKYKEARERLTRAVNTKQTLYNQWIAKCYARDLAFWG